MNRILSILALLLAAAGPLQAGDNTCNPSVVANPNSGDLIAGGPAVNFTVTVGLGDCPTTEQISYSGSITYLFGVGIGDNNGPCDTLVQGLLDAGNPSDEYQCGFMAAANAAAGETASVEASIQGSWIDPPAAETPTGGGTQIALFTVVRVTNLTVSKIGGGDVFAPAPFFHNISVANGGPSYATTIVLTDVTDPVPVGVTGPTYAAPSHGTVTDGVWTINELPNGQSASLVVDYTTTAAAGGTVHDTATVTGNAENQNSAVLADDETSTVIPEIDIAVTSSESIDQVLAGWPGTGNLTYVVTATNNGPGAATGLALSASLTWPAGVTVDSITPSVGAFTNTWPGTWTIGNLASGASQTLTIVLTVGTGAAEGTDVINLSAEVSALVGTDTDAANDTTVQATSIVWAHATFDVTKEYLATDAGPVTVSLQCSDPSGFIEFDPTSGPTPALLTVRRFDAATTCSVVETPPAGYSEIERTEDCDVSPVADQGAYSCTLTNAQIRATFEVTKDFSDGNPSEVEVSINCFTGLPLQQSQFISETQNVVFVVTEYEPGELDCEITEAVPAGYSPTYGVEGNEGGVAGSFSGGALLCEFTEVVTGQFACQVENAPDPVDVVITKEWVFEGSSSPSDIDTTYELTLFCDAEIIGGDQIGDAVDAPAGYEPDFCGLSFPVADSGQTLIGGGLWCKEFHYDGPATFTAQVIPDYPSSECEVIETVHDSAVEVDNDCGDLVISAGQGASCTITNTVFFEGIPTLNQYGVAILALLMLGVGLVGFRRFN